MSSEEQKCACGLRYPMGNVGDLMKHGMLAEYARWHCETFAGGAFRFLDPFAGAAFCDRAECAKKDCDAVKERGARLGKLSKAGEFALCKAQDIDGARYVGGSEVVARVVAEAGAKPEIRVSDSRTDAIEKLAKTFGFAELRAPCFDQRDGYSILNAINQGTAEADLVLLDPYSEFLGGKRDEDVLPRMAAAAERAAVVLFVLDLGRKCKRRKCKQPNETSERWDENKAKHLRGALVLSCPYLKGEGLSFFRTQVVLAAPCLRMPQLRTQAGKLRERLKNFADALKKAVEGDAKNSTVESVEFSVVK